MTTKLRTEFINNLQAIHDWNKESFNVLVIDDDPSMTQFIRKIIGESSERKVYTFHDEVEVIKAFYDNRFDLCIIDISLEKTDGFALGKLLRTMSYKEFPIIYISRDNENLVKFYKNDQPNSFFYRKPINKVDFIEIFKKMTLNS